MSAEVRRTRLDQTLQKGEPLGWWGGTGWGDSLCFSRIPNLQRGLRLWNHDSFITPRIVMSDGIKVCKHLIFREHLYPHENS